MTYDIQGLLAEALENDFLVGGLGLAALGAAYGVLHMVLGALWRLGAARLWLTVTLDNRTDGFRHLLLWLEETGALRKSRRFHVDRNAKDAFAPAKGVHWFRVGAQLVRLSREMSEKARVGQSQRPLETLSIQVFGGRKAQVQAWLARGAQIAEAMERDGPKLFQYASSYWQELCELPARPLGTVLSVDDRLERLLEDVRWFYAAKDWYVARGVPWRRGYLLYGPPGTGKSSLIRAVASELHLDVATLDIARRGLGDEDLREAMAEAPDRAILAIEDIDAAFQGRDPGDALPGISFSGLLNAIDGVAAQEGRALFMTTNHRERLDPALIRPGRADMHVELGLVGAAQAAQLFARFYPERADLAEPFAAALGTKRFSPAELQGWLMAHMSDPEGAARAEGLQHAPMLAAE
ncbi:Cell division protein FtsH [Candidatus Rhodobacter oscarellae]|uniref:Cell division protein FtsH n=1 Tax=Candidatus Rhodobacter oscarellae TaxID=1675527 RepID=A0A0J9E8M7_9RHOB|nr:AAA family ATPase [Candidatus Rhodobacter lobularis]KMW58059.1 Cell division protein FtsH [Candidatus Rhodobacter lobularis]